MYTGDCDMDAEWGNLGTPTPQTLWERLYDTFSANCNPIYQEKRKTSKAPRCAKVNWLETEESISRITQR